MLVAVTSSADTIKSDVVYGHKDGMALVYDVLMPDSANGAAILFMSGGWYSSWAPPETRARQFKDMLDAGFSNPCLSWKRSEISCSRCIFRVSRAVRHVKLNAVSYGVDVNRIGVTGGSAGGHLSLMLGLDSDTGKNDERCSHAGR